MTQPLFERLRNANIATIYDDVDQLYWWLLRGLPALRCVGFDTFTFPTSWRTLNTGTDFQPLSGQFDYLDYDYRVLGELEADDLKGALVVFTNTYYESETQYSINNLVNRYSSRPETLVVVTNAREFEPRGGQRPLYMEQSVEHLGSYERLYRAFEAEYNEAGFEFPLLDTRNLFLHDNANLYELVEGDRLETTAELFDVLPDCPYLPLYQAFGAVFAREDDYGSVPLDEDELTGLDRWLRRRIEWDRKTAQAVASALNSAVRDDGKTFDPSYVARSGGSEAVDRVIEQLSDENTSIHNRYCDWLQARPQ